MNATPLGQLLDVVVQPYVSPALITPADLTAIQAIARPLPSTLTTFFGFECRLGAPAGPTDLLLSVMPPWGRDALADLDAWLPDEWRAQPVWQRLAAFARDWADAASVLHHRVNNVWMEFDVPTPPLQAPVPSVFFGPQPLHAHTPHDWVAATAMPLLRGAPLPAGLARRLTHCIAALPGDAYVFQIGLMLARDVDAVRLCIRNLPAGDLLSYLQRVGWQGNAVGLAPLVAALADLVDRIDLDLDVGDAVLPKLGLECYIHPSAEHTKLAGFLDYLLGRGWCRASKRDALLDYAGYVQERADPLRWPRHLINVSELLGPAMASVFLRFINHVKVVYGPDGHREAKAYLAVAHGWCPRTALRPPRRPASKSAAAPIAAMSSPAPRDGAPPVRPATVI